MNTVTRTIIYTLLLSLLVASLLSTASATDNVTCYHEPTTFTWQSDSEPNLDQTSQQLTKLIQTIQAGSNPAAAFKYTLPKQHQTYCFNSRAPPKLTSQA